MKSITVKSSKVVFYQIVIELSSNTASTSLKLQRMKFAVHFMSNILHIFINILYPIYILYILYTYILYIYLYHIYNLFCITIEYYIMQ